VASAHRPSTVNPVQPAAQQRRAGRRVALRQSCTLTPIGQPPRQATTFDVGADGLSLIAMRPVSPGTRCRVDFSLPGAIGARIEASAKVVYSSFVGPDGFRIGLVFVDLPEAAADALAQLVAAA
jgi:hypothetical protein